jgi:hypothetical protein
MPFAFSLDLIAAAVAVGLALVVLLRPSPSPSTRRRTIDTVVPIVPRTPLTSNSNEAPDASKALYEPSIADVLIVKAILTRALALPVELVNVIADLAEY